MLRNPINRNTDSPEDTSGATITAPGEKVYKGFDALSNVDVIETAVNTGSEVEKPADTTTPAVAQTPAQTEAPNTAVAGTEKPADEAEDIVTEFKIPGAEGEFVVETPEQIARKEALATLEKDQSWTALAKTQGFDITENSFDAFEKGVTAKFEVEKVAIKESAVKEAKESFLSEKPAEVMAIVEGLEAGYSIDEILEPKRNIEKLEALSDAELVAEDCRLNNWPQGIIDKHIADLTERDTLDVTAQPLRDILKSNKETLASKQLEQLATLKQSKAASELKVRERESDEIKNTLVSMKTYMDVPITDSVVNHVQQKWNKGEYHEAFKESKTIAEFLMYKEFGEQGLKALKNREYQRGRDEKASKLHNIPPVQKTGGKATTQQSVRAEGNFGALPGGA